MIKSLKGDQSEDGVLGQNSKKCPAMKQLKRVFVCNPELGVERELPNWGRSCRKSANKTETNTKDGKRVKGAGG